MLLSVNIEEREGDGETLAELLTRHLAEQGITQQRLAADIGVPLATLNTWVKGKRVPKGPASSDSLRAIADRLGLTPREVFAAAGRRAPGPLSEEREQRLLRLYRSLSVEGQRMLITNAEQLARMSRAS